jgi:hypothetical protein
MPQRTVLPDPQDATRCSTRRRRRPTPWVVCFAEHPLVDRPDGDLYLALPRGLTARGYTGQRCVMTGCAGKCARPEQSAASLYEACATMGATAQSVGRR